MRGNFYVAFIKRFRLDRTAFAEEMYPSSEHQRSNNFDLESLLERNRQKSERVRSSSSFHFNGRQYFLPNISNRGHFLVHFKPFQGIFLVITK